MADETGGTRPRGAGRLRLTSYGGQLARWDASMWLPVLLLALAAAWLGYGAGGWVFAVPAAVAVPALFRAVLVQGDAGRARRELRACLRDLPSWQDPESPELVSAVLAEQGGQVMHVITLRSLRLLPGLRLQRLVILECDAALFADAPGKELANVVARQYELSPLEHGVSFGVRDAVLNRALPEEARRKRLAAQWKEGQRRTVFADTEQVRALCARLGTAERARL